MSRTIPFDAPLADYEREGTVLLQAVRARKEAAEWRFKWLHSRFRGKPVGTVREAAVELDHVGEVIGACAVTQVLQGVAD